MNRTTRYEYTTYKCKRFWEFTDVGDGYARVEYGIRGWKSRSVRIDMKLAKKREQKRIEQGYYLVDKPISYRKFINF